MNTPEMTWDEARELTDEVKADTRALWLKLERLYEGGAHTALGFKSWGAYCAVEFNLSATRAYELLDAGRVAQILARSAIAEPGPQSEGVSRELAVLRDEPEAMRDAWTEAVEQHGPQPTAAQVREIVRPEPPGNDLRFTRIENAIDSLRTLPVLGKFPLPVEAGDVDAMDAQVRWMDEWWPQFKRVWRAHKAELKRAAADLRSVA